MKLSKGKINKTFNKKNISNKRIKGGKKKYKKSSNKNKKDKHISNKSIKVKKGKNKRKRSIQVGGVPNETNITFWTQLFNTLNSVVPDKDAKKGTTFSMMGDIDKKKRLVKLEDERKNVLVDIDIESIDELENKITNLEANTKRLKELEAKDTLQGDEVAEKSGLEAKVTEEAKELAKFKKAREEYKFKTNEIMEKSGKKSFSKMPETPCSSSKSGNVRLLEVTEDNRGLIYGDNDFITLRDVYTKEFEFIVAKPTTFVKAGDKLIIKLPTDLEVSENQTITRLKNELGSLSKKLENASKEGFSLCALLNGDFSSLSKLNPMGSRNCGDDDDEDEEEDDDGQKK
jgi:hypothetical protein